MRAIRVLALATAVLAAILLGTASGSPQRLDSGISGLVVYGPTCPVQRLGQSCERPYEAVIAIRREPAGSVIARVRSAADGRFTVRLRTGRYRLEPRNGAAYPRAQSQTTWVRRDRFTAVTIRFDSGIR